MKFLAAVGALALIAGVCSAVIAFAIVRHGFSANDEPTPVEVQLTRVMRRGATPASVRHLKSPLATTPDVLAQARHHWADHCATCHANDGGGDTQMGKHLYPRAPDIRAAATQELSDGELYSIIQNGIRLTGMPAWGARGDAADHDSWALVAFVRHLPKQTPAEIEGMTRMNPKGFDEWREELEEERFLRGEDAPQPAAHQGHSP